MKFKWKNFFCYLVAVCFGLAAIGCGTYSATEEYYTAGYYDHWGDFHPTDLHTEVSYPLLGIAVLLGFVAFVFGAIGLFGDFEEKPTISKSLIL